MKPTRLHQTRFGDQGNCFATCLAMLLGMSDPDEVPNFYGDHPDDDSDWFLEASEWMADHGYRLVAMRAYKTYLRDQAPWRQKATTRISVPRETRRIREREHLPA